MGKSTIKLPEDMSNYIEALDYDVRALRDLLCTAAERGIESSEAYAHWEQEYLLKSAEFQVAKAEMERNFVTPHADGARVSWFLDYATHSLTIEEVPAS